MRLAEEPEASLKEFLVSALADLQENGARTSFGTDLSWEVRGGGEKALVPLWSGTIPPHAACAGHNGSLQGAVGPGRGRFGRAKPDRLEFVRREFERDARQQSREEFCARLSQLLAEQFPEETVESLTISADLEHSQSRAASLQTTDWRSLVSLEALSLRTTSVRNLDVPRVQ